MPLTKPAEKAADEMTAEIFAAKYPEIHAGVYATAAAEAGNNVDIRIEAAHKEAYSKGLAEGTVKGAKGERDRIQSVFAKSYPGFEAIIKEKAFDGKSTGPETAEAILVAMKEKNAKGLTAMKKEAPAAIDSELEEESEDTAAPPADPLKAAWEKGPLSAKLKKQFGGDWDSYKAYYENEEYYKETKEVTL